MGVIGKKDWATRLLVTNPQSSRLLSPSNTWQRLFNCAPGIALALLMSHGVIAGAATPNVAAADTFTDIGTMSTLRFGATATRLQDGSVILIGGRSAANPAEVFDPASLTFTPTSTVPITPRSTGFTSTLLASGEVLIAGGEDSLSDAEIYSPSGLFTVTGDLLTGRRLHTATLLADGRVFIAGGEAYSAATDTWGTLDTTELFDPLTGIFSAAAPMADARLDHTATLLADGSVLIAGGRVPNPGTFTFTFLATSEIYHPDTDDFTSTGPMNSPRSIQTATLLANGKVLIAGGFNDNNSSQATSELYDPGTQTFTVTGSMHNKRGAHTANRLANGNVLISGGVELTPFLNVHSSADVYQVSTGQFAATSSMTQVRLLHISASLTDGRVLVAGGAETTNGIMLEGLDSAEIYTPGFIFRDGFD